MSRYKRFKSRYHTSQFSFDTAPSVTHNRSKFNLSHGVKTSMSAGRLYPVEVIEVLPGDTFDVTVRDVSQVSTAFLRPVLDTLFEDKFYFFVPSRIVYDKWGQIFGENDESAWARQTKVVVPKVGGVVSSKSVGDYFGLPLANLEMPDGSGNNLDFVNVLPFRAFALIWNEWFRNQNVQAPMHIQKGDLSDGVFNNDPWTPSNYLGQLPFVNKKKDYFTACLPAPQKGDPVTFGIGDIAPVSAYAANHGNASIPINWNVIGGSINGSFGNFPIMAHSTDDGQVTSLNGTVVDEDFYRTEQSTFRDVSPANLYADLSNISAINVNDFRIAVQTQKLLERAARGGTRYREYLLAAFGVKNADSRMQVPEYLAGARLPLNVQKVAQTNTQQSSQGTVDSPLATLGATSNTFGRSRFIKSFSEHGYLFAVSCIRQMHTYQQGIPRMFLRSEQLDYYDPLFQSIGEQPVYSSELYYEGGTDPKANVFGYNEAWADYRFAPSKITGQMRSNVTDTFDIWHFGDYYSSAPVLSPDFVEETPMFIDRTLAAPSTEVDQFLVDIWLDIKSYRCMPVRSIPGYVDHY